MENIVRIMIEDDSSDEDLDLGVILNSDDSEDSDDEDVVAALVLIRSKKRGQLQSKPRIENYVEKTVAEYNRETFKSHFRMYPETVNFILGLIGPSISSTKMAGGRKPIDAKKQLLICLWVMATPDSYRSICEKFNVGKATAIRAVRRVSLALHTLAPRFISWPTGARAKDIARKFESYSAFPGVVGAIDGTHINIIAPIKDSKSYINRKGKHSIQVQAVCTWDLLFTSMFAGNAGSVHDARVFRLSPINDFFQDPDTYFPDNLHLVGDAAYGIHQCLMVPFKDNGHLTQRQKNFNFCLSSAQMSIERAFGLWKTRWRSILHCLPMVTLNKIPEYLLATAVLHNICIMKGDMMPMQEVEWQLRVTNRGPLIVGGRELGVQKRQAIMNNLILRDN